MAQVVIDIEERVIDRLRRLITTRWCLIKRLRATSSEGRAVALDARRAPA